MSLAATAPSRAPSLPGTGAGHTALAGAGAGQAALAGAGAATGEHRRSASEAAARTAPRVLDWALAGSLLVLVLAAPWAGSLAPVLAAVVALAWGLHVASTGGLDRPALLGALALIPVVQLLSLTTAIDPERSAVLATESVLGWACAAAAVRLWRTYGPRLVLGVLGLGVVVVATQSLTGLGRLTSHSGGSVVTGRLQGPFAQPNELGAYAALLLPLLVAAACHLPRPMWRLAAALGAVPVTAALLLSLSRGAWLGATTAIVVLLLLLPRTRTPLAASGLLVLSALSALAALSPTGVAGVVAARIASMTQPGASPDDDRVGIWTLALHELRSHPLLGVGPGGLEPASLEADSPLIGIVPLHAHSVALTVASETGVVGLLALVGIAVTAAVVLRRVLLPEVAVTRADLNDVGTRAEARLLAGRTRALRLAPWTTVAPLAGLSGAALHGIIDMPWRNPALTFTAWVLAGALTAGSTSGARAPFERNDVTDTDPTPMPTAQAARRRARRPWILPLVLGLLASVAVVGVVLALPTRQEVTAVVGLRAEAPEGEVRAPTDELRLIAQQYAVAISAEPAVDDAVADLDLGRDATADASVDPESTTLRIDARAADARDASRLADRLVGVAQTRAKGDDQVTVELLARPTAAHATPTPPKPLYLGAGLGSIWLAALALWLLRRAS